MNVGQKYLSSQLLLLFLSTLVVFQYLNLIQVKEARVSLKRPLLSLDFLDHLLPQPRKQKPFFEEPKLFLDLDHYLRIHPELKNLTSAVVVKSKLNSSDLCPLIPPDLNGPFHVLLDDEVPETMEEIETQVPYLKPGGSHRPENCQSRHKVAVIVPYRNREEHLRTFLINIHRFLQPQLVDYTVFVVEQFGDESFNRAMLMNVGAVEARNRGHFQCYIFHDVDLLPEDDRNLYTCPVQPRHMSVAIDNFLYKLPYDDIFGGVSAMSVEHFQQVNGFSNLFWGWGGEDDDMSNRLRQKKLYISRYPSNVARYKMLKHNKDKPNPERFKYLYSGTKRISRDGLSSLEYKVEDLKLNPLYTWILVKLPHLQP